MPGKLGLDDKVDANIQVGDVDVGAANPVPISATAIPLPTGAATSARQDTGNTSIANVDTNLGAKADVAATSDTGSFSLIALFKRLLDKLTTGIGLPTGAATAANQQTDALTDTELRASAVPVDGSGVVQPISASSLPLPTGAATAANQQTDALTDTELRAAPVGVDGSGVTQPISASSLPLPTGAATAANQQTDALTDTELRESPVKVEISPVADANPQFFEDTNFVTGDSPVSLDINTALSRNSNNVIVINDGPGSFTAAYSNNGSSFGDEITVMAGEKLSLTDVSIDTVRITWVSDSSYRVIAV